MITEKVKSDILTSGMDGKSSNFSIGDSSVAFDILRKKLYSDPLLAVMREYACNARDANREAKRGDEPIKVILPTITDLTLKIKDHGLGISPDRMEDIYVKYGVSNKRASNEFVGYYGIGSKVAFSYTDQFSVETIYNGVKYLYSAFLDESDAGKMVLAHQESTDEPSGTTIIIPVKKEDIKDFIRAAEITFIAWDQRPNFVGLLMPERQAMTSFVDKKTNLPLIKAFDHNNASKYQPNHNQIKNNYQYYQKHYQRHNNFYVVMDGVRYHISNPEKIYSKSENAIHQQNYNQDFISYISSAAAEVEIYAEMGKISISASREQVYLDDQTIEYIKNIFNKANKEVLEDAQKEIDSIKSFDQLEKVCNEKYFKSNFFIGKLVWNDMIISNDRDYKGSHLALAIKPKTIKYSYRSLGDTYSRSCLFGKDYQIKNIKHAVIIDDSDSGVDIDNARTALRKLIRDVSPIQLVQKPGKKKPPTRYVYPVEADEIKILQPDQKSDLDQLIRLFDGAGIPYQKLSELYKPRIIKNKVVNKLTPTKMEIFALSKSSWNWYRTSKNIIEENKDKNNLILLEIIGNDIYSRTCTHKPFSCDIEVPYLRAGYVFLGVKKEFFDQIKKEYPFVQTIEQINANLLKKAQELSIAKFYFDFVNHTSVYTLFENQNDITNLSFFKKYLKLKNHPPNSICEKDAQLFSELIEQDIIKYDSSCNSQINLAKEKYNAEFMDDKFYHDFPMVKFINKQNWSNNDNKEIILQYLIDQNLINKKKAKTK